ncbi:MAG: hypothetical protein P8M25_03920 [Paracoccaceae bacterium]|nr:hypothetical protein [Paracoccaceae bacterium]
MYALSASAKGGRKRNFTARAIRRSALNPTLILVVLIAAFLHAFWNAVVKGTADNTIFLGLIVLGYVITGLAIIALTLMPGWGAAPYILA